MGHRLALLFLLKKGKVFRKIFCHIRLFFVQEFCAFKVNKNGVVDCGKLRRSVGSQLYAVLLKVAVQKLFCGQKMVLVQKVKEAAGGKSADDSGDHRFMRVRQLRLSAYDFRDADPGAAVGRFFQVVQILNRSLVVQRVWIGRDVIYDALVDSVLVGPHNPVLHAGNKFVNVKAAYERRIQVGQLVFLAAVYRRDYSAAFRKRPAGKLTVQGQVHNRLQNFRPGSVQFVQKQDDWRLVGRKPIRRHKFRMAGRLVLARNAYQVAGIAHLAQKERNDLAALFAVKGL